MARRRKTPRPKNLAGPQEDAESLAGLADRYLAWLAAKNYSGSTIDGRRNYLRYFLTWCRERSLSRPVEVTRPILERYQRYLFRYRKQKTGEPLSVRSQHSRLVPVRAYFKWLARQNFILNNPASELELPKLDKRLPKHILSRSEAEQVLNTPDVKTLLGLRDRAMLETFYSTGLRRMELIHLKLYDLDRERGTLMIRLGKGRKDRMIPIGERAVAWIDAYLRDTRPELAYEPDGGWLFLTNEGEAFTSNRLTQLVRDYVKASGVNKSGACHLFRHTMATLMHENGADIRFVQQMLGHASLETTQIYTQVSLRKLKEIHSATHPARLERTVREELTAQGGEQEADELT